MKKNLEYSKMLLKLADIEINSYEASSNLIHDFVNDNFNKIDKSVIDDAEDKLSKMLNNLAALRVMKDNIERDIEQLSRK